MHVESPVLIKVKPWSSISSPSINFLWKSTCPHIFCDRMNSSRSDFFSLIIPIVVLSQKINVSDLQMNVIIGNYVVSITSICVRSMESWCKEPASSSCNFKIVKSSRSCILKHIQRNLLCDDWIVKIDLCKITRIHVLVWCPSKWISWDENIIFWRMKDKCWRICLRHICCPCCLHA